MSRSMNIARDTTLSNLRQRLGDITVFEPSNETYYERADRLERDRVKRLTEAQTKAHEAKQDKQPESNKGSKKKHKAEEATPTH